MRNDKGPYQKRPKNGIFVFDRMDEESLARFVGEMEDSYGPTDSELVIKIIPTSILPGEYNGLEVGKGVFTFSYEGRAPHVESDDVLRVLGDNLIGYVCREDSVIGHFDIFSRRFREGLGEDSFRGYRADFSREELLSPRFDVRRYLPSEERVVKAS